jgi:aminopeptidase YwaD
MAVTCSSLCLQRQSSANVVCQLKKAIVVLLMSAGLLASASNSHAQDVAYAHKVVNKLASPAFKGRGYVGNGAVIASGYIAAAFKHSGLLPLNEGSYFQNFQIPVNTFPGKMEVRLNDNRLVPAVDYLVDASSPAIHGRFPVVLVSQRDVISLGLLKSRLQQADSVFLFLDARPDSTLTKEMQASFHSNMQRLLSDQNPALKGMLILTTAKLTWTTLDYQSSKPVITINKKDLDLQSIRTIAVDVDASFLPEYTARNVAGMIKGSSNSDSTVVISAHYDHLGMMGKEVYFPGANDNASGVAMMLSFVKYYASHKPRYNTVFLAFSGEEIGLQGSSAFVEHPLIPLKAIKFLVNFDLAGTGNAGIKIVNGSIFRKEFDKLVQLNNDSKLLSKVEIRGEACISDHCPFYAKGVPSFFIYTQGGIAAYHDVYDRPETLPLTAFESYFKLMVKFFAAL